MTRWILTKLKWFSFLIFESFDIMKKLFVFLTAICLLVTFYYFTCLINKNPVEFSESLGAIELRVDNAIQSGDKRFLGVMGIGLILPGVPDRLKDELNINNVNVISGTSDAIKSKSDEIYQKQAYQYALQYNKILLKNLVTSH